jgi:alpha-methylacyl-CoA racemase
MTGPLDGIRVLDLSWVGVGCVASWLLAEMGADVVKVEPPDGSDNLRNQNPQLDGVGVAHLALDRNKRSFAVNLRTKEGQDAFLKVAATADAIIEGFRPGVADRLGIGYQAVKAINPRITYVTMTGYGVGGPLAQVAAHDINYDAQAGLLSLIWPGPPGPPPLQAADYLGASLGALAVTTGVLRARQSGEGAAIEASLYDGVLYSLVFPLSQSLMLGADFAPGSGSLVGGLAGYGTYPCQDGLHLALGALEPKFWNRFSELVGIPPVDNHHDPAIQDELRSRISEALAQRPRAEWLKVFEGEDVCVSPVLTLAEALAEPHLHQRGGITEVLHPGGAHLQAPAGPLKIDGAAKSTPATVPTLGDGTRSLLVEAGVDPSDIEALHGSSVIFAAEQH